MINSSEIINQLHNMSYEEIENLAKDILEETGIPYSYDDMGIVFDGLINHNCEESFPNIQALNLRDKFFIEAEKKCPYYNDGNDLIIEIPNIDLNEKEEF